MALWTLHPQPSTHSLHVAAFTSMLTSRQQDSLLMYARAS